VSSLLHVSEVLVSNLIQGIVTGIFLRPYETYECKQNYLNFVFGRPRHIWEENIEMEKWDGVVWTGSG
jgi:hypothetical protein